VDGVAVLPDCTGKDTEVIEGVSMDKGSPIAVCGDLITLLMADPAGALWEKST
jgi:hypothetical protein